MSPALRRARIVAGAILVSGVALTSAGVFLALAGGRPAPSDVSTTLFWTWVAAALGGLAGWYALWQRARGPRGLTRLIAAWALLEAQLVVAFAVSFLSGTPMLLVPGLTILALGLLLSFPRS